MTTCPRCGHVADDAVVCPSCGLSLAGALEGAEGAAGLMDELGFSDNRAFSAASAKTWRVATFAGVTILLIAVAAVFLVNMRAPKSKAGFAPPLPYATVSFPAGPPVAAATTSDDSTYTFPTLAAPPPHPSSGSSSRPSPSKTPSKSTTSTPSKSSSHSTSTSPPPPPQRSVEIEEGSSDPQCNGCRWLIVTLVGFPPGSTNTVACFASRQAGRTRIFGGYSTTATVSTGCAWGAAGSTVQVVVDSTYESNVIIWQ